jgi:hypothetical protein
VFNYNVDNYYDLEEASLKTGIDFIPETSLFETSIHRENDHNVNKKGTGSTFVKYQSVAVLFECQISFSTTRTQRVSEGTYGVNIWIKVTLT